MKKNKTLIQKIIAVALSLTGIATTFAGCNNSDKEKEQTQTKVQVETTAENETEKTYFESLKEEEKKEIKFIMGGLHIPSEWTKNDDIVSEILHFITLNKNYTDDVQFINSIENNEKYYYTSDGNILFIETGFFEVKKVKENNMSITRITLDDSGETIGFFENVYYDNGNLVRDTFIASSGIVPDCSPERVVYSTQTLVYKKAKARYYSDDTNFVSISPHSKEVVIEFYVSTSDSIKYIMTISDEEMEQLITYFDTYNQTQFQKLVYELIKKYEGKYEVVMYKHSDNNNNFETSIIINKYKSENILLSARCTYPIENSDVEEFDLECEITNEENQKMMLLLKNNDYVGIINYTKQLEKKYNTNIEETTDYAKTYSIN